MSCPLPGLHQVPRVKQLGIKHGNTDDQEGKPYVQQKMKIFFEISAKFRVESGVEERDGMKTGFVFLKENVDTGDSYEESNEKSVT